MASFSASASSLAIEFQEGDMDNYLQQLQSYTFIQEQGFDPLMRNCKGIWENATKREWKKFCLLVEKPLIILVVQDFYLALKQREAARQFYEMHSFVKVKRVNVPVTEMSIFQICDAPYYYRYYLYKTDLKEIKNIDIEEILRFLTEGKEMWTYRMGTVILDTFNQELMTPKAKMWMKFVCSRIWPITKMSKISPIQAIITYGILQKKQICIRTWIYKNMVDCTRNLGKGIFFPHLITKLCKRAGVPIERMYKTMNPPRKLLNDELFKQRRKKGFQEDED
ncbi:hypothetical protein Gohar_024906 [Gossypium harknessii]|uniref:Putative plant transposon protein domain-containing protein n=1 Tax=Gossypium harknessii TaxID=34285 RepID=A0A7J9HK01_9ROSI|nr:hypothetical protein [Gossypium harknessii]